MATKLRLIPIAIGSYTIAVAIYIFCRTAPKADGTDFWTGYYWMTGKGMLLFSLLFSKIKEKDDVDELFVDFAIIQCLMIMGYYLYCQATECKWFTQNEFMVYSWVIASFIALLLLGIKLRNKVK